MEKHRIGKDFFYTFTLTDNTGAAIDFTNAKNIVLEVYRDSAFTSVQNYSITGNKVTFQWSSAENKKLGIYNLRMQWDLVNSNSETGYMHNFADKKNIFQIVTSSEDETESDAVNLTVTQYGGIDGKSAYELAVANGFTGTITEWLDSLSLKYSDLTAEEIADLKKPATDAAADVSTLENTIKDSESLRVANENDRIANEEERKANENSRVTSENTRTENETSRVADEKTRTDNETLRVNAESERETKESTRESNETTRKDQESSRQAGEKTRNDSEQSRVTNETSRQSAEADRVTKETSRQSSETTRQANETSRVNAETARESVIDNFQMPVSESLSFLLAKIRTLENKLNSGELGDAHLTSLTVDAPYQVCGQNGMIEGSGAPSDVADFTGQRYHDTTNKKVYEAFGTSSISDWIILN